MKTAWKKVLGGAAAFICLLLLIALVAGVVNRNRVAPIASVKAGKTETSSSMSSSRVSSSVDNAAFACKRLVIFCESDHKLMRRVARQIADGLTGGKGVESVEIAGRGSWLTNGARGPDLFVKLGLVELKTGGVLNRTTKARVEASLGSTPWISNRFVNDDSTPPFVRFSWNGTLDIDSTFTGVRSDPYGDLADGVSEQFTKAISNEVHSLSGKFMRMPELPKQFYGPYEQVEDFSYLMKVNAARMFSYYDVFTHNQTFWRFDAGPDRLAQLKQLIDGFQTEGWKVQDCLMTNTNSEFVRMGKAGAELCIFRARQDGYQLTAENKGPVEFVVHYRKQLAREERQAAIDLLFSDEKPVETLLAMRHSFSSAQYGRFYELLKQKPSSSAGACLVLAEHYLGQKDTNSALRMLLHAKALSVIGDDVSGQVDTLAKKISPRETLKLEVTREVCLEAGFMELTNGFSEVEVELAAGKPLLMFRTGEKGVETVKYAVQPPHAGMCAWSLDQAREGARSRSSGLFDVSNTLPRQSFSLEGRVLNISSQWMPDGGRFKHLIKAGS